MAQQQYLNTAGLQKLWAKIVTGFAPINKAVDLSLTTATATKTGVSINFTACGVDPNLANPELGTKPSGSLELPVVSQTQAGIMTAADKTKLDGLGNSIDGAIALNGVAVNGTALKISTVGENTKHVNFALAYDATGKKLNIVDKNNSNAVLSSVEVNNFIGDAILSHSLTSASIVDENDKNVAGTFLKMTFSITELDGGTKSEDVYANVADLVSTYSAGTGISITDEAGQTIDGVAHTGKITLNTAGTDTIGGIKIRKDNTSYVVTPKVSTLSGNASNGRYFGVEIDKNDAAFVYVPSQEVTVNGTPSTATATTAHGGTFTAVTGISAGTPDTNGNIILTPTVTTYTLPSAPNVSVGANTTADGGTIAHSGEFTVVTAITENGHGIKYTPTKFTLPTETGLTLGTETSGTGVTSSPGDGNSFTAVTNVSVSGHVITLEKTSFTVSDPGVIPNSVIEGLSYSI